ncbi:hypothetical protein SAMN04487904_102515 [Actinopolyspora lacussalsi subsp. righensis]|uniref:Uncharacterized protein n=1 Tax=Actinopolyspora righensis TaxID=995060 RepID=A0A1I6YGP4_9ACTN|nr:hypothetical protein [Actinopolyspora righensis]SFT49511.1 hypothetical protein SAMN04487904_102515 [Actinopolyspora righensis]
MSHPATLPPCPDPRTGQPRPPRAPLVRDRNPNAPTERGKQHNAPRPPHEASPMVEWFHRSRARSLLARLTLVSVIFVIGVFMGGVDLPRVLVFWVTLGSWALISGLRKHNPSLSAGVDWLTHENGNFVLTYQLASVEVAGTKPHQSLRLVDVYGNEFSSDLDDPQRNRELWDLVYNGILHSVHVNGATISQSARDSLELDNPLRFRGE